MQLRMCKTCPKIKEVWNLIYYNEMLFYMISSAIFRRFGSCVPLTFSEQVPEAGGEGGNQKNHSIHHRTRGSIAVIRGTATLFTLDVEFAAVCCSPAGLRSASFVVCFTAGCCRKPHFDTRWGRPTIFFLSVGVTIFKRVPTTTSVTLTGNHCNEKEEQVPN